MASGQLSCETGQLSRETEVNRSVVPHIYHLISQDRRWCLQEGCASPGCSIVMCQQGHGPGLASLSGHATMKCTKKEKRPFVAIARKHAGREG